MEVELCRLSDGKISVRLDGDEVAIMPKRSDCGLEDVKEAMQKIADEAADPEW